MIHHPLTLECIDLDACASSSHTQLCHLDTVNNGRSCNNNSSNDNCSSDVVAGDNDTYSYALQCSVSSPSFPSLLSTSFLNESPKPGKAGVCSCVLYALRLLYVSRLLKQRQTAATLKIQRLFVTVLAWPAATCYTISLLLWLLTLPIFIDGCSVRPRNAKTDNMETTTVISPAAGDSYDFPAGTKHMNCSKDKANYCLNDGICYAWMDVTGAQRVYCDCPSPFGGSRCEQISHIEMFEVRMSNMQMAAMSTLVVSVIAAAVICSSALYFYRRHLKGKEEAEGGFIRKCAKSWVGKRRYVQNTELQPLKVTALQQPNFPDDTRTTILIDPVN